MHARTHSPTPLVALLDFPLGVLWLALACAMGCSSAPGSAPDESPAQSTRPGADADETAADAPDAPPQDAPGPTLAEFELCGELYPDCAEPYECTPLGRQSYCVRPCTDATCPDGRRCHRELDVCLRTREAYDVCGGQRDLCPATGYCISASRAAPSRCLPVCARGTLQDQAVVEACPNLPSELSDAPAECLEQSVGTLTAGFCSVPVPLGAACDDSLLRCNLNDTRPDTAPSIEPAEPGTWDVGAPHCASTDTGYRCLRICSVDGGTSTAPCECPSDAAYCNNPDAAAGQWRCAHVPGLPQDVHACVVQQD